MILVNFHYLNSKNLQKAIESTIFFLIIWVVIGYFIIYNAQSQIKTWAEQEHKVVGYLAEPSKMHRTLISNFKDLSRGENPASQAADHKEAQKLRVQIIPYFVMRQYFLNPVKTPIMTESFLRKDFRFDMYLSFCYGKTLTKFFQISIFSILMTSLCAACLYPLFERMDDFSNLMIIFGFTAILFTIFISFMANRIEAARNKLTPSMYDPKGNL